MALTKPKPKKKKNPYRLSSDRQPEIAKANKGKKKKGPKFDLPSKKPPKYAIPKQMEPYRPAPGSKRFPDKEATPIIRLKKKDGGSASFPDLSGDGKVTKKDILMGRGVVKKKRGGPVDSPKKKKKNKKGGILAIGIEIIKPKPIKAANGGLAGRLAKRGYGKAKK